MKRVIFFATAAAVAMSAVTPALASMTTRSYFEGEGNYNASAENIGAFGLPIEDKVSVSVDIQSRWSPEGTEEPDEYTDHSTSALSRRVRSSADTANFDSIACLDMENVAKEWNAYIDAAINSDLGQAAVSNEEQLRALILNLTELNGEFNITITVPNSTDSDNNLVGIENEALVSGASASDTTFQWSDNEMGYSVSDFFEMKSSTRTEDAEAGTLTYAITMVTKADINEAIDKYFEDIIAASDDDKDNYRLQLTIPNNTVGTVSSAAYEIEGKFNGSVTIDTNAFNNDQYTDQYTVYFGNDTNYESFDTIEPAADTELVRLTRYISGGGGGGAAPSTPGPVTSPSESPSATTEPGATDRPGVGTSATHTPAPVETEGTENGAQLNYEDHYAYIIGYPAENGAAEVRPQNNITRAEVATIFFRMLTDESRAEFWTKTNPFPDVNAEDWFNNAISTATNAGILNGYDTGDFKPNAPITRAEFAAIAARFSSRDYTGANMFSDISGHWAANDINKAAEVGWITGYEDGTFRPDQYITRAEAMTLINRVLYRLVDEDGVGHLADMVTWPDNTPNMWYYAAVQEATNSHHYEREAIGYYETWTQIREPRDWAALETELSEVTDAGEEESVFFDEDDVPAVSEEPTASEEPATSEEPAASEEPTESEEPATSEEPTESEEATTTEAPEASESPEPSEAAE